MNLYVIYSDFWKYLSQGILIWGPEATFLIFGLRCNQNWWDLHKFYIEYFEINSDIIYLRSCKIYVSWVFELRAGSNFNLQGKFTVENCMLMKFLVHEFAINLLIDGLFLYRWWTWKFGQPLKKKFEFFIFAAGLQVNDKKESWLSYFISIFFSLYFCEYIW